MIAKLLTLWATYGIRKYLIPAAIGGAAVLLATTHYQAYQFGRKYERYEISETIRNENAQAGQNAENGRTTYRRCVELGRVYNFERGRCD